MPTHVTDLSTGAARPCCSIESHVTNSGHHPFFRTKYSSARAASAEGRLASGRLDSHSYVVTTYPVEPRMVIGGSSVTEWGVGTVTCLGEETRRVTVLCHGHALRP